MSLFAIYTEDSIHPVALQGPETNVFLGQSDHKTPPADVLLFQRQRNPQLGLCGQSKGGRYISADLVPNTQALCFLERIRTSLQKMMKITLPGGEIVFPSAINSCLSYFARIHCSFKTLKREAL